MSLEIEIEVFRERARRELGEIDETLHRAEAGTAIVQLDQTQTGRLSRMDALQQQAMSSGLLERLRADLAVPFCSACQQHIDTKRKHA